MWRFAEFELDTGTGQLTRGGAAIRLPPKPFALLVELLARHPACVSSRQLMQTLWPETTVTQYSITRAARGVRRALGESADEEGVVRTVRGRGYRIGVPVEEIEPIVAPVHGRLAQSDFVGREAELARLDSFLREAAAGSPAIVLLCGEPGIGRSRMADVFADRAHAAGARVAVGRSQEGEEPFACWPWVEVARACVAERPRCELEAELGIAATGELARLLPELRPGTIARDPQPTLGRGDEPNKSEPLFDAVRALLYATSRGRPLVVILEDLHEAGTGTLRLLRFVARSLRAEPLLLLLTFRCRGHPRNAVLEATLADLAGLAATRETLHVSGFSSDEVQCFAAARGGAAPEPGLAAALRARTGGNPFFLRELLRMAAREGKAQLDARAIDALGAPESAVCTVRQRLGSLEPAAREVIEAAAVVGSEVPPDLLARVSGLSEEQLVCAIEAGVDAAILEGGRDGAQCLRFAHPLLRESVLHALSPWRCTQLARRAERAARELAAPRPVVAGRALAQRRAVASRAVAALAQPGGA